SGWAAYAVGSEISEGPSEPFGTVRCHATDLPWHETLATVAPGALGFEACQANQTITLRTSTGCSHCRLQPVILHLDQLTHAQRAEAFRLHPAREIGRNSVVVKLDQIVRAGRGVARRVERLDEGGVDAVVVQTDKLVRRKLRAMRARDLGEQLGGNAMVVQRD